MHVDQTPILRTIKSHYLYITVSAICLLLGLSLEKTLNITDYKKIADSFEKTLHHKESQLKRLVHNTDTLQKQDTSKQIFWEEHQGLNSGIGNN